MITIGDKVLRNLEEQVLKNKEDIARHYEIDRALANLGIKIVGQVTSAGELPDPLTYTGEFGDAYAVGDRIEIENGKDPNGYTYYVFTRPDPNAGIYTNQWLDVGKISIAGPQGPQGEQGLPGTPGHSTRWYTNAYVLPEEDEFKSGDMLLTTGPGQVGNVYIYSETAVLGRRWGYVTSIQGPKGLQGPQGERGPQGEQGPQGPKGATGDVGGFIQVYGILSNVSQLPTPASLGDLTIAYLVGASAPYDLYIQIGSTSASAIWNNMGPLNVATLVSSGGQYQNFWDADTKLDKDTSTTEYNQVYVKSANGGQGTINVTKQALADAVVQRNSNGNIGVNYPSSSSDATSKAYVDAEIAKQHIPWNHLTGNEDTFVPFDLSGIQMGKVYQLEVLPGPELESDYKVNKAYNAINVYSPGTTIVFKPSATTYNLWTDNNSSPNRKLTNATTIGAYTYDEGGPLDIYYRFIEIKL